MIKFIYLVQGQSNLVKSFLHLKDREYSTAILLTYDVILDGALYLPNSTWAEGRNLLLERATDLSIPYDYVIFVDDDTQFYMGSWAEFEKGLELYQPLIAVPVFDRTVTKVLPYPLFQAQRFTFHDEQLMAFSRKVVDEGVVLPYQTHFDKLHWWATCRAQQILIHNIYTARSLQFNFVRVLNAEHDRYDIKDNTDESYKDLVLNWVHNSYSKNYQDINKSPSKIMLCVKTFVSRFRITQFKGIINFIHLNTLFKQLTKQPLVLDLQELKELIQSEENWILYGFGDLGKYVHQFVSKNTLERFSSVVDKSWQNEMTESIDVAVLSPDSILNRENTRIVIASFKFKDEIRAYLRNGIGISDEQIYCLKPFSFTNIDIN